MADRKRVNATPNEAAEPDVAETEVAKLPRRSRSPKPPLGQHFLNDSQAATRIVDALGDISNATVIEIGPGRGALTETLISRAGHLIAIELDRVLAAQMRMKYARLENVEILEGDVLTMDFSSMLGPGPGRLNDRTPHMRTATASVVGNIPYYITSDILLRLFQFHKSFDQMVIMIQKEVADRIAAKPGNSEYGLLSATAQLYTKVEKLFTLPPGAFSPPPQVYSVVLRLTTSPRFEELNVPEREFIDFLKLSFGQKRKTLVNNLKGRYPDAAIKAALKAAGLRADVRAEALPLEKAAAVFHGLSKSVFVP